MKQLHKMGNRVSSVKVKTVKRLVLASILTVLLWLQGRYFVPLLHANAKGHNLINLQCWTQTPSCWWLLFCLCYLLFLLFLSCVFLLNFSFLIIPLLSHPLLKLALLFFHSSVPPLISITRLFLKKCMYLIISTLLFIFSCSLQQEQLFLLPG